jgi:acetyl-CoA C-acetyltransferase
MTGRRTTVSTTPQITGWAHSAFGRLESPDVADLMGQVVPEALVDAGLEPRDVDAVFVGVYNAGFARQDFSGSLVAVTNPEFRHIPATRVENACATGSAALYAALDFIESGRGRTALVVGAEKMTGVSSVQAGDNLLSACYVPEEAQTRGGFAGVFAGVAREYFDRYGDQSEALARIAAKNHRNGVDNPYAQLRRDLGFEFCNTVSEKNPYVAEPLRRTDCSLISDGAAALVVTSEDVAAGARRRVRFRARAQVNDYLPLSRRDPVAFDGARMAWEHATRRAGLTATDLDLIETHDCFTIAELIQYEVFGLAEPGRGADVVNEGLTWRGGEVPVNLSGGLKSKGHPIGATGVSMHVLVAKQLVGEAGDMQLPGASVGAVFNMGGTGVANYVSVLEAR